MMHVVLKYQTTTYVLLLLSYGSNTYDWNSENGGGTGVSYINDQQVVILIANGNGGIREVNNSSLGSVQTGNLN